MAENLLSTPSTDSGYSSMNEGERSLPKKMKRQLSNSSEESNHQQDHSIENKTSTEEDDLDKRQEEGKPQPIVSLVHAVPAPIGQLAIGSARPKINNIRLPITAKYPHKPTPLKLPLKRPNSGYSPDQELTWIPAKKPTTFCLPTDTPAPLDHKTPRYITYQDLIDGNSTPPLHSKLKLCIQNWISSMTAYGNAFNYLSGVDFPESQTLGQTNESPSKQTQLGRNFRLLATPPRRNDQAPLPTHTSAAIAPMFNPCYFYDVELHYRNMKQAYEAEGIAGVPTEHFLKYGKLESARAIAWSLYSIEHAVTMIRSATTIFFQQMDYITYQQPDMVPDFLLEREKTLRALDEIMVYPAWNQKTHDYDNEHQQE